MKSRGIVWGLLLAVALIHSTGARASSKDAGPELSDHEAITEEDVMREELRQTELDFAASVRRRDVEAFKSFIAPDAVFVGEGVNRGREAIVAAWAPFFAPDGPRLEWHPEVVELAEGGALGLTRGPYTFTGRDENGAERTSSGLFNSVWRRQPDGTWRIVFDAGC